MTVRIVFGENVIDSQFSLNRFSVKRCHLRWRSFYTICDCFFYTEWNTGDKQPMILKNHPALFYYTYLFLDFSVKMLSGLYIISSLKVELSPPKKIVLLHWKPFKIDEKRFLFHLKSSLRFQDIYIFLLTFWPCRKNRLIREIRSSSKFMTSQLHTITKGVWPNISGSKDSQTMEHGQVIEYNKRNILLQKLFRKWDRETSSRPLFHLFHF